ncbi:ROK family protein [Citricoccus sp. GCM10030269]|uniref:ROK family protein n=1 Tax=Citricoccus sp. GCM10030269 TaxID=3273388 RepID=UPI0036120667
MEVTAPRARPVAASIGLDVGGGAVKAGTVVLGQDGTLIRPPWPQSAPAGAGIDAGGEVRTRHHVESDGEALAALCAQMTHEQYLGLRSVWPELPVTWGVSAAAWIEPATGRSVFSPHLMGWRDRPLPSDLSSALSSVAGLPSAEVAVFDAENRTVPTPWVINDADAAAWAEARWQGTDDLLTAPTTAFGDGRGDRMVLVAVGTGIGGALVRDGVVDIGAHGMAGEFGHMTVDPSGVPCPCGNTGCWELLVSAEALAARAGRASARSVMDEALAGDPVCRRAVAETGRWLGRGLATLTAVLDPSRFVIGGGVAAAGELLLEPARAELVRHLPGGRRRPVPPVRTAALGNRAGWVGAAGTAVERAGWPVTGVLAPTG